MASSGGVSHAIGYGRHQRQRRLGGIDSRVLDDYRNRGTEKGGVSDSTRQWISLAISQLVHTDMVGSHRRTGEV